MDFLNEPFDVDLLPKSENVVFTPVERVYLTVIKLEAGISSAILLLIAAALIAFIKSVQHPLWISVILGAWLLVTAFYFFLQKKAFEQKAYALRDKDVLYRSGWIVRRIHTCPFNRVQHSSVTSGILERRYGLATLILYTAGTNDADLQIPGLKEPDAHRIKEWITQKIIYEEPRES